MKKNIKVFLLLCMTCLFTLCVMHAYALEIHFVVGDAVIEREGTLIPVAVGTKVLQSDIVITKKASIVELLFADNSLMRIFENTKVKIATINDKKENISVINGIMKAKVSKLQKGESKKVYTPTTVCAIRGTEFVVAVSDSSNARVNMEEGTLALVNPYGETNISGDEQATAKLATKPEIDDNPKNPEAWKNSADKEFIVEPEKYAQSYDEYLQKLAERSQNQAKEIKKYKQSAGKKKAGNNLQVELDKLNNTASMIEDDYLLVDCANAAVEQVLEFYKDKKVEIFDTFSKVKKQANRVMQQQKANYEAIMAIKEAYRKNYEAIKGKHKESLEKIKEEVKKVQD